MKNAATPHRSRRWRRARRLAAERPATHDRGRPAPQVLVVDADPALVALLAEWLAEAGCAVDHPGRIAPRHVARYDLAIVDLPQPRQDGARRVADIAARHPGIPIIAVSAAFFPAVCGCPHLARALGVVRALPKPLSRDGLLAAVREQLKR